MLNSCSGRHKENYQVLQKVWNFEIAGYCSYQRTAVFLYNIEKCMQAIGRTLLQSEHQQCVVQM
jgi:hypothetical protein